MAENTPDVEETTPAQEWGDRVNTGRSIARGGQDSGAVPGATEKANPDTPADPSDTFDEEPVEEA